MTLPDLAPFRLPLVAALCLGLAACDDLVPGAATATAPVPAAPQPVPPAAAPAETVGTAPAVPAVPARPGLTREGQQVITLEIRNLTDTVIVSLTAVQDGRTTANLLAPGTGIPVGGTYPVPAAPGTYLLQADLQAPSVFARGRQIQRRVIVPRFPPNPPPQLQVTLR